MGKFGKLRRLFVVACATAAVLAIASATGAAPGTDADISVFDQCANGKPPSTSTACPEKWINGILNEQNSHYAEDEVVPQRVVLELPEGGPTTDRSVEISYLTRKGGVHAYDSLATWNYTQTTADRCADLNAADCVAGPESTFPIPLDSTVVADANGPGSPTAGHQLTGQVFTMYGGTITGVSSYTHDDPSGTGDSYAHITLTYSVASLADDAKVMLLFGGHIGASLGPRGWGAGVGAGSISGGPYHIRITAADGASVGNRDNQIMSGAILAPANLLIKKVSVGGDDTFGYTATGGITSPFTITTSGGNGSQSFTSIEPKAYTVTESAPPTGWDFTSLVCQDDDNGTTVTGQTANIDLDPGETVTCTYTNTKRGKVIVEKQTIPDGSSQLFTFTPSYGASFQLSDGQQNDSGFLVAGTYSVSETVPSGWSLKSSTCDDGSSPSAIGLGAGETVKCTFTNEDAPSAIVVEKTANPTSVTEPGGPVTFTVLVKNTSATDDVTLTAAGFTDKVGAGPVEVISNIDCNGATAGSGLPLTLQENNNAAGGADEVTCTFTKNVNGNAGASVTDVVEVTGTDDDGNTVKDDDDATVTITARPVSGQGSIDVEKSADPTSVKEPGAPVNFTVTVTNTSNVPIVVTNVTDSVFGDLDDDGGSGIFDVPINLAPGDKVSKTFQRQVNGTGGQVHTNVATATGIDNFGNSFSDSDDARVEITPRLIDLVIVKTANPTTVALNGTLSYTMTVTNKGPDTATNVQLADPAPSGISYLSANPSKGTCNTTSSLITCSLGNLAANESVTITISARATATGTHTNVATVTGGGGRETNPADNTDDAVVNVPAPFVPPSQPKPKPQPEPVCLTLTVSPKMIKADGKPDRVSVKVTAGKKRVKGTKVVIRGAGVNKSGRSNANGMAFIRINPRKAGLITITAVETNQRVCGPKRIGVVGVFLPPLTG